MAVKVVNQVVLRNDSKCYDCLHKEVCKYMAISAFEKEPCKFKIEEDNLIHQN